MKNKLKISMSLLAVSMFFTGVTLPTLVIAEEANSSTENLSTEYKKRAEEKKESAKKKREELQSQAESKLKSAQENKQLRTTEARKKSCEARSEALGNKIKSTSEAAQRHVEKIDSFNEKIVKFVADSSLDAPSYEDKQQAVVDTQAAATEAVTVLKEYSSEIDCSDIDATTTAVSGYKEALKNAREAIVNYRKATKDLLVEVKTAAERRESGTESETESTQSETNQIEGVQQ